jgi:hypothetical protein
MPDPIKNERKILLSVQPVVTAFHGYLETSEKSLINSFSRDELEKTLNVHSSSRGDRESGWYRAISRRLEEMDREDQYRKKTKERLVDWAIGFFVGVGVLLVGEWILKEWLKWK